MQDALSLRIFGRVIANSSYPLHQIDHKVFEKHHDDGEYRHVIFEMYVILS
jgi:hypothetical protein